MGPRRDRLPAALGLRRKGAHIVDGGVDGDPQWFRVAGGVRDHRAALVRDDQRYGQVSRVGVGAQIAASPHRREPGLEQLEPFVVPVGEIVADFVVGVDQLARQRTVDASAQAVDGVDVGHAGVGPRLQGIEAVERAELRLGVECHDVVAACGDDLAGQIALVAKVVRDLGSAHPGGAAHFVDAGVGDAALEHEPCGDTDDACPGRQSFAGESRCAVVVHQ